MDRVRWLAAAVTVAVGTGLVHGGVHAAVPVPVAGWQAASVAATLFVAPLAGVGLAAVGRVRTGAALVAAAMTGGLAFEAVAHFVVRNPDHVVAGADGHVGFAATAALSVAGDAVAGALAALVLWRERESAGTLALPQSPGRPD
ncbi:hypothetical protein [Halostella litorea]|uniref:hypothetical protein n=1 Tax=Halostella litorea TaxID=2528831 RepID=UPI001092B977|nr:hypothetical protein [Halostella litorea]